MMRRIKTDLHTSTHLDAELLSGDALGRMRRLQRRHLLIARHGRSDGVRQRRDRQPHAGRHVCGRDYLSGWAVEGGSDLT